MQPNERMAHLALLHAVSGASACIGLALAALHEIESARADAMPDRRMSGVAMFSVGCLFKRLGIPAAEVAP